MRWVARPGRSRDTQVSGSQAPASRRACARAPRARGRRHRRVRRRVATRFAPRLIPPGVRGGGEASHGGGSRGSCETRRGRGAGVGGEWRRGERGGRVELAATAIVTEVLPERGFRDTASSLESMAAAAMSGVDEEDRDMFDTEEAKGAMHDAFHRVVTARWFGSSRNTACPWTRRPRRNAKRTSTSTRHPLKTSRTRQVGPSKRLRFAPSAARPKSIPKKNRRRRGPRSASIRGSRTHDRGSWTFRRWMRRRSPPRRRTSRPRE